MNKFFKAILFIISVIIFFVGINYSSEGDTIGFILMGAAIGSIVFGCVCERMCYEKGREEDGFFVGYFLGIIGLIIVATMKDNNPNKTKNFSKYDELKKIQELKESGVLTEEEFEREKNKILRQS